MLTPLSFLFTSTSHNPKPATSSPPLSQATRSGFSTSTGRTHKEEKKLARQSLSSYESGNTTSQRPAVTMANPQVVKTDPVVIPSRRITSINGKTHTQRHKSASRSTIRYGPPKKDLPPAVAALLANTAIPRPRQRPQSIKRNEQYQRLTVDAVLHHNSEKEFNSSIECSRTPLDLLLSPPEELDAETQDSEEGSPSYMSGTTMSSDSTPSLIDDASSTEASPGFPITPQSSFRERRRVTSVTRKKQERSPANSPPLEIVVNHPLSDPIDVEELDFRVFSTTEKEDMEEAEVVVPKQKSAFKSNLTASLRALRSAAKSISNLAAPTIRPDDFLTRSIMRLDPGVPFTDERMPPLLDSAPTPALRRYLNPMSTARIEAHVPHPLVQTSAPLKITASIQMTTYKVSAKVAKPVLPPRSAQIKVADVASGPVARQRDMRENSDFIRVAVMEMLMRRNGKLADNVPGRARWALPPRKERGGEYKIEGGVPARWIGVSAS